MHASRRVRRLAPLTLACAIFLGLAAPACGKREGGPRALLERYFATAARQDYGSTWECYYDRYRTAVPRDEFVRHRREASRLESWRILSVDEHGDRARASVELVFAASPKLNRSSPVRTTVSEELVRERDGWRVKVW